MVQLFVYSVWYDQMTLINSFSFCITGHGHLQQITIYISYQVGNQYAKRYA